MGFGPASMYWCCSLHRIHLQNRWHPVLAILLGCLEGKRDFFFPWSPLSCFERFSLEGGSYSVTWPLQQCGAMHAPALFCRASPSGTFSCTYSSLLSACQQHPPSLTRSGGPHTLAGPSQDLPALPAKSVSCLGGK